jgi:hypothetical protein
MPTGLEVFPDPGLRCFRTPREIAGTPQYKQFRRDRKKVEMPFAQLERILELDRSRLRGLTGAHDEFLLAATAQNVRTTAKRFVERQRAAAVMPARKAGDASRRKRSAPCSLHHQQFTRSTTLNARPQDEFFDGRALVREFAGRPEG